MDVRARPRSARNRLLVRLALAIAACHLLLALASPVLGRGGDAEARAPSRPQDDGSSGCLGCHAGIEDMHPGTKLSCVDCHGGDATARLKLEAHVPPPTSGLDDERVADLEENLTWRRFRNPMDLRIVDRTCGNCHGRQIEHLLVSLHGTTAGHLSDGYYEVGLSKTRGSKYSVFPVRGAPKPGGEVDQLAQVPAFRDNLPGDRLSTHYTDLARKECMQCHLWSQGRAVRGRVGFDGDYRGEGCAACHVSYAIDGLSESGDPAITKGEPGHPRVHAMVRAPATQTCTSCHYGDASIGLHFRGLSQLPPNTPGGPDIPGTTDRQLNRVFYLDDPAICPPDVHFERGMDCVDCHTRSDVMGDGKLHGQMEHAVEISCQACHGTFTRRSDLRTERGTPLEHLRWDGEHVILTTKVSGEEHVVPQAVDVIDPSRPEYNPAAARAMRSEHRNIECYTCHAGWNVNFLGFHFSRIASLTQLDLLSGRRTPGRVTTQEKVFATWKSFYAGLNERGAVAPYLTGFSTMGSVWDEQGELVLDQVMPETAAGLSGMTMVHHQLHSTRPTARSCVECHRTSATWGMGSPNFRLGRQLAFVADRRGIEVVGINRAEPARSVPLMKFPLPDVVDLAIDADPLQGHAHHLYVAEGGRGVHVLDVTDPLRPKRVAFVATIDPQGLELVGEHLYLADGVGGLKVFDVSEPEAIRLVGKLPTFDAHDLDVQWPWAYLADGAGGLAIVDVRAPIAPRFLSAIDLNRESSQANEAIIVRSLFQYSRPIAEDDEPVNRRTRARNLCAVLDRRGGLVLVDVTEPGLPQILYPDANSRTRSRSRFEITYRGLVLLSQVDPAEAQGGERTAERDYAYVLLETGRESARRSAVELYDVSDPVRARRTGGDRLFVPAGYSTEQLVAADFYNPPFRQRMLFSPGELGVYIADVSTSREPVQLGVIPGLDNAYAMAVEEFPLDRMIDDTGKRLKDISHEGSRWLYRTEIERILDVSAAELRTDLLYPRQEEVHGETARMHLASLDRDGSGFLEGEEYEPAGGAGVDDDGDGRIALIELARHAGLLDAAATDGGPVRASASDDPMVAARTFEDGDLARLLDGVDPFAFDGNGDDRLDRKELERAFFAALDLDGDGKLTRDELSRHPGELRQLRFGDASAELLWRRFDKSRDGTISRREFQLQDPEWRALDADQDGSVRLVPGRFEYEKERGFVRDGSEWPTRRKFLLPLPPGISAERLLERFDADGDGTLSRGELRARPELFQVLDGNDDGSVERAELDRAVGLIGRAGVDLTPDDFMGRWDLDRSGKIEPDELPDVLRLRLGPSLRKR